MLAERCDEADMHSWLAALERKVGTVTLRAGAAEVAARREERRGAGGGAS